jgi:hypothetical protein
LSKMGRWGRENPVTANEAGGGRERKGSAARVVGKARGEAVSSGAKEAADKNVATHLLHAQDREHMRAATSDGAPTGVSGLSKMGAAGQRKHDSLEQNRGCSRGQGASLERHIEGQGSQQGCERSSKERGNSHAALSGQRAESARGG